MSWLKWTSAFSAARTSAARHTIAKIRAERAGAFMETNSLAENADGWVGNSAGLLYGIAPAFGRTREIGGKMRNGLAPIIG